MALTNLNPVQFKHVGPRESYRDALMKQGHHGKHADPQYGGWAADYTEEDFYADNPAWRPPEIKRKS